MGTLYGVDHLFYEWLELDTRPLDEPNSTADYGNSPAIAREICLTRATEVLPPITEAFQQIQNNHQNALIRGPRPPQNSNYRWSKQLTMQAHNSGEKRLEKLAASILNDDWVNQVPVCSGFTWASEGKRAIDLARRISEHECEFIELKYARDHGGANHPLYAIMEILEYGLVYLMARNNLLIIDADPQTYLRGVNRINLVVLAPAEFFNEFEIAWLLNALNNGLAQLVERENLNIEMSLRCNVLSNEFITFYHDLEDKMDNRRIYYEEPSIKSNDDDINLDEIIGNFQMLFPLYENGNLFD